MKIEGTVVLIKECELNGVELGLGWGGVEPGVGRIWIRDVSRSPQPLARLLQFQLLPKIREFKQRVGQGNNIKKTIHLYKLFNYYRRSIIPVNMQQI